MCHVGQSVANGPPFGLLHTKLLLRGLHLVPMFGESIDSSNQITKGLSAYLRAVGLDPANRDAAGPRRVGRTITYSECSSEPWARSVSCPSVP